MTRAYVRHIRASKLCMRGARAWCARHNINYTDFLQNGIDCDVLAATGDHFALIVCKIAREEEAAGQQEEVSNG
jgi:hypothetical protein